MKDEFLQPYSHLHCSNPDAYSFVPVGGRDNDTFREHRPSSCQVLRQRIGDSKGCQHPEISSMTMNAKKPLLFDCEVSHSGAFFSKQFIAFLRYTSKLNIQLLTFVRIHTTNTQRKKFQIMLCGNVPPALGSPSELSKMLTWTRISS